MRFWIIENNWGSHVGGVWAANKSEAIKEAVKKYSKGNFKYAYKDLSARLK